MKHARFLVSIGTVASLVLPGAMIAATSSDDLDDDPTLTTQSTMPTDKFLQLFTTPVSGDDQEGFVFDQTAFQAHPCFDAVGEEVDFCLEMFGVTTDFSASVASETDVDTTDDDDSDSIDMSVHEQTVIEHNESVTSDEEESTLRERTLARSERLWDLCMNDELGQAGCYQNFIRFITSDNLTVSDIEEFFNFSGGDDDDEDENDTEDEEDDDMDDEEDDEDMDDDDENSEDDDDVQSEIDSDMSRQDKAQWLWGVCSDSAESQANCYRRHYRTAIDEDADLATLEQDIR